tara:strand:- start:49 stop:699 length:651 start_codon:yes stop_codon:yes gene_type:complete
MATPFKMKGSPMQRNFGIGSPLHQDVETKTKSTKRVDKSRSRLLADGNPSELTYATKNGKEIEALDINKKIKKGKKGNVKKVKEVVLHDGGKSQTKRIQKVTKSGKVKTKNVTWRGGKRTVSRSTSDSLNTGPILKKSPVLQCGPNNNSGACDGGRGPSIFSGKKSRKISNQKPGTVISRTYDNIKYAVKKKVKKVKHNIRINKVSSGSYKTPRYL